MIETAWELLHEGQGTAVLNSWRFRLISSRDKAN
jgi:hypothetical protein